MISREARPTDVAAREELRCELWPDGVEDHAREIAAFFTGKLDEPGLVLVVEDESGALIAVAVDSLRCLRASRQEDRLRGRALRQTNQGIARKLLQVSKDWSQRNNCEAFATDRAGRTVIIERF